MSDPTIRIPSCRQDGRCPECAYDWTWVLPQTLPHARPICGCLCCPLHEIGHVRDLLTEALRQRDAEKKVTYDRAAGVKGPHILVHRQMWDQLREERDAAIRKGAAERAMLDEILALPDIEAPAGDGSENVASVVASALEALREERDAAIRERDRARTVSEQHEGDFVAAKYEFGVTLTKERERVERAEALLRDCMIYLQLGSGGKVLLAKIREALGD